VVPYLFFEAVYILIFGLRNGFDFGEQHLYSALLMQPLNVPIWFLITLFAAELLMILLAKLTKQNQWAIALICVLLYLIPFAAGSAVMTKCLAALGVCTDGDIITPMFRCFTAVGFLAAGYFGSETIRRLDVPAALLMIGALTDVLLACYNGKTGIYKQVFGNPILFTICGLLGSLTVIFLLKKLRIKPLETLGTHSITILGLHIIVLRVLQEMIGLDTDGSLGGILALALICGVLTAADIVLEQLVPWIVGKKRRRGNAVSR
jgi:fucose 4-O-acetylase-like acetyltransferase